MGKFCTNCGKAISVNDRFCTNCGSAINNTNINSKYTNNMGIAGFVVSLVSLFMCCCTLSWLSLIFSIIGVKNANKHNGEEKGLSIAGVIISSISLAVFLIYLVMMIYIIIVTGEI